MRPVDQSSAGIRLTPSEPPARGVVTLRQLEIANRNQTTGLIPRDRVGNLETRLEKTNADIDQLTKVVGALQQMVIKARSEWEITRRGLYAALDTGETPDVAALLADAYST